MMPCFDFSISRDGQAILDVGSMDFPDIDAACQHALSIAQALMSVPSTNLTSWKDWQVDVLDATGRALVSVPFAATRPN